MGHVGTSLLDVDCGLRQCQHGALSSQQQQAIVIEIVATSWKTYAVAKMFSGFSSGWMGPAIMTYMSEISMPEYRGALLALFAVSFKIGTFANAIACQIVNVHWPLEYRRVFYSEFVMVGIFGTVCVYLPESPSKCAVHGPNHAK